MGTWIAIPRSGMMMPDADGFERNTLIEGRQRDICGNATGNGVIRNAILLSNYVGYLGCLAELHPRK